MTLFPGHFARSLVNGDYFVVESPPCSLQVCNTSLSGPSPLRLMTPSSGRPRRHPAVREQVSAPCLRYCGIFNRAFASNEPALRQSNGSRASPTNLFAVQQQHRAYLSSRYLAACTMRHAPPSLSSFQHHHFAPIHRPRSTRRESRRPAQT